MKAGESGLCVSFGHFAALRAQIIFGGSGSFLFCYPSTRFTASISSPRLVPRLRPFHCDDVSVVTVRYLGPFDNLSPVAENPSLVRVEPSMCYFLQGRQYAQWMYSEESTRRRYILLIVHRIR